MVVVVVAVEEDWLLSLSEPNELGGLGGRQLDDFLFIFDCVCCC